MNLREVAEVEELSEPEFTQQADTASIWAFGNVFWGHEIPSDLGHTHFRFESEYRYG